MLNALRSVFPLLFGAGLLVLGNGLIGILVPIRLGIEKVSADSAGLVMSSFYLGFMLGSSFSQHIIGRAGHVRAFAALAALLTAAALVQALEFDLILWAVMRVLTGFCMAGLYAIIESWLNVRSTNQDRGRILSVYLVTVYVASLFGQFLVNAREVEGLALFVIGALLTAISLVPVVLTRVAGPELGAIKRMKFAALYRASPLGMVATWGAGMLSGAFYGLGAIYAEGMRLSVFEISLFMGVFVFGGLVLQWPIGRLSDRFDRRSVLLGVLVMGIASSLGLSAVSFWGGALAPMLIAVLFLGGSVATVYPIALAQTFDYVDGSEMVSASSGLLLTWAVGATAGPVIASTLMGRFGPTSLFVYLAAMACGLALFTLYRMVRRHARPAEEQITFVPMQTTSPLANALDPRADPLPEFYYDDEDPGDR